MPCKTRWSLLLGIGLFALLGATVLFVFSVRSSSDPEAAYSAFCYSTGLAEDQLMDPLILAGEGVVPLVVAGVKDKAMPRRRYAIHFLGTVAAFEALPVLRSILRDPSEEDYMRADALQAMALIDLAEGKKHAAAYTDNVGFIKLIAEGVIREDPELLTRRTYSDAFYGRHD